MGKVLVVYASKAGSTAEVADRVGQAFCSENMTVDVRRAREVKKLDDYQAVVLGTAIRMGKPVSEMMRFAQKHSRELAALPTACFSLGLTMMENTPEKQTEAMGHLQPLLDKIGQPVSVGLFAGKVDFETLSPFFRMTLSKSDEIPEGDWRDWDAIDQWASDFAAQL